MKDTIKKQIEDLLKKRKENLEKVRIISDSVREKADEIVKLRKEFGIRKNENERSLKRSVEEIELRISTENLPLKVERELADEIAKLEKRIALIKEIEKKRSRIGELEKEIKTMKDNRDRLKNEVDTDIREVETLRSEMRITTEREASKFGDLCLGDLVTMKKDKKQNN